MNFEKWIHTHQSEGYHGMVLKANGNADLIDAITQFEGRRKASRKISNLLTNPDFRFPTVLSAEQCTSWPLAQFHASLMNEGSKIADLTCGLGIDTIALSGIASTVYAIDLSETIIKNLCHNLKILAISNVEPIHADCVEWVKTNSHSHFDAIFIDPYRRNDSGGKVVSLSQCQPDVTKMMPQLLSMSPRIIIKASPMLDISKIIKDLFPHVSELYILGTTTECKEVVIVCEKKPTEHVGISSITFIDESQTVRNDWILGDESNTQPLILSPAVGDILYEPYPATMKAGCYNQLTLHYHLGVISTMTHLYVANKFISAFPGRPFKIVDIVDFNNKNVKSLKSKYKYLNVATRNFPVKAQQLQDKLKIKPGGDYKLFGVTLNDGSHKMIITSQTCEP